MPFYIDYKKVKMEPIMVERRELNQRPYAYSMVLDALKPTKTKKNKAMIEVCDDQELTKSQSETQATEASSKKKSRIKVKILNKQEAD